MWVPLKQLALTMEEGLSPAAVRLNFCNLHDLARAGRNVTRAHCVGSRSSLAGARDEHAFQRLAALGYSVEVFDRGAVSGSEQAVDQALQAHMLRAALTETPGVVVLMTGDGAGYDRGAGFHFDLELLADRGWGIEVIAWDAACNHRLRDFARSHGVYVPLESFYQSVTFVEGGRRSDALSLKRRRVAQPAISGANLTGASLSERPTGPPEKRRLAA
jgi:hypothetical protein